MTEIRCPKCGLANTIRVGFKDDSHGYVCHSCSHVWTLYQQSQVEKLQSDAVKTREALIKLDEDRIKNWNLYQMMSEQCLLKEQQITTLQGEVEELKRRVAGKWQTGKPPKDDADYIVKSKISESDSGIGHYQAFDGMIVQLNSGEWAISAETEEWSGPLETPEEEV